MKNVLIILFLIVSNTLFAQKYLILEPVIAPDSAGCNGKAKAVFYGGSLPIQRISWWSGSSEISFDMEAENLCDSVHSSLTIQDSDCSRLHAEIRLYHDTSFQITIDTVLISMPSSSGMCDGTVQIVYNNITPNHVGTFDLQLGSTPYSGPEDSTFTYTGICEGEYTATVRYNNNIVMQVGVNLFLTPTALYDCQLFDSEILISSPTTDLSCDGRFDFSPIYGPTSGYSHSVYQFFSNYSDIIVSDSYNYYVDNLCRGLYQIHIANDNSYLQKIYRVFLDTNDVNQIPWNMPDSLLPDTDTIWMNAIGNCAINYNSAVDSAYISSITEIGNGQFEFEITIEQDTNIITLYSAAVMDTSLNFFIDITTFCLDSTRSNDPYLSKRFMIYHGVQLQSSQSIRENNFFSSLDIYPNPSENIFQIDFESKESSKLNFELTDITGKLIHTITYTSAIGKNHLNLSLDQWASGLYLLNIRNEKGLVQTQKLLKE